MYIRCMCAQVVAAAADVLAGAVSNTGGVTGCCQLTELQIGSMCVVPWGGGLGAGGKAGVFCWPLRAC
jgi:hypothetical protein